MPWGEGNNATARIVAVADGYHQVLSKAQAGYTGTPHEHEHANAKWRIRSATKW
jgi:hypothetical protein